MFEVIVTSGVNDGKILGEFREYNDACDMAIAYNHDFNSEQDGTAVVLDQKEDN